jgi:hypothetical protein
MAHNLCSAIAESECNKWRIVFVVNWYAREQTLPGKAVCQFSIIQAKFL